MKEGKETGKWGHPRRETRGGSANELSEVN